MSKYKKFIDASVAIGCCVTGSPMVHFHHCLGRKAKHNKVHIGEWYGLPIAIPLHDVSSNHPLNITHHKKAFVERYNQEANLWLRRYSFLRQHSDLDEKYYPPQEVVAAITDLIIGD